MNWQSFKSFYELFETGKTKNKPTLDQNAVFMYHAKQTKELLLTKKEILVSIAGTRTFRDTFISLYLDKYNACFELLNAIGENTPQCRFDVGDILILKEIKRQMDCGELLEIRQQIIESNETKRGVSLMFFKNEKHIDSSEALERAVKTILKIDAFADSRDFQYLYVLQCNNAKAIVLCENLYFLKMPERPRKNGIELWYAGGRNIEKLNYANSRDLPIYYMCDWDHDGLDIYRAVRERIPQIKLLTPNGPPKDIVKTEHRSQWLQRGNPSLISKLPAELFSDEQQLLIQTLIRSNCWIIEESNNLIELMFNAKNVTE